MSLFGNLFGKSKVPVPTQEEQLIPVPIPALGAMLANLEKQKGAPLSESEVLSARDNVACIMLPLSAKLAMDDKRGYKDINPENVWVEWQQLRSELLNG